MSHGGRVVMLSVIRHGGFRYLLVVTGRDERRETEPRGCRSKLQSAQRSSDQIDANEGGWDKPLN